MTRKFDDAPDDVDYGAETARLEAVAENGNRVVSERLGNETR
ncbi:uncharacterized protein METZ01_LOCUS421662 [marine metagenome]|uniref:Uncharacterized protein n=1 Tax=marine metagenome TaxID=408172 RepID=A0A382XEL6_9ZZZZ